ncbi:TSUP family transporter [Mesorhizobium sp. ANAO-SY3R2]|uniref:TSUP family transporter n=1 Tax=Mesorhizobium sp. ANAO-SY3R2 TaxID=3166644 RepID=UPI00366C72CE
MTLGDVSLWQYLVVAAVSFGAATIGGVTGYGTGLLLPPVLLPIVGPEAVVPIISVAALMTNGSRLAAFRSDFDRGKALAVGCFAFPACIAGAYGYTLLSGPGITLLIGSVLIVLVPLRRLLLRRQRHLNGASLNAAGLGYGLLAGGTAGSGVVLITILLAAGLSGTAVVATDAGISMTLGLAKILVFQSSGFLPLSSVALALLIGVCATPGAFVAKRLTSGLTNRAHIAILDVVVVAGGLLLIVQGLRNSG